MVTDPVIEPGPFLAARQVSSPLTSFGRTTTPPMRPEPETIVSSRVSPLRRTRATSRVPPGPAKRTIPSGTETAQTPPLSSRICSPRRTPSAPSVRRSGEAVGGGVSLAACASGTVPASRPTTSAAEEAVARRREGRSAVTDALYGRCPVGRTVLIRHLLVAEAIPTEAGERRPGLPMLSPRSRCRLRSVHRAPDTADPPAKDRCPDAAGGQPSRRLRSSPARGPVRS